MALRDALTHVHTLTDTGRIARADLRALRAQVTKAHRASVIGRRISRLVSGTQQPSPQPALIVELIHGVMHLCAQDTRLPMPKIAPGLADVQAVVDPTLARQLIQALIEWVLDQAVGTVDVSLIERPWPRQLSLAIRFTPADPVESDALPLTAEPSPLDSMLWHWVHALCVSNHLGLSRSQDSVHCEVTVSFSDVIWHDTLRADPFDVPTVPDALAAQDSMPLVGLHVLVVTHRRTHRQWIRNALRSSGMMLDFVNTAAEAADFCAGGLPHAIVADATLGAGGMHKLLAHLSPQAPALAYLEVTDEPLAHARPGAPASSRHRQISTQQEGEQLTRAIAEQLLASSGR